MKAMFAAVLFSTAATLLPLAPAAAQQASPPPTVTAPPPPAVAPTPITPLFPRTPPKLIVAISVDQFSADLFQQ